MVDTLSYPPFPCKLALVGEAPGAEEIQQGRPFVGESGRLLDKLLKHAKLERSEIYVTNVFSTRPRGNNVKEFFTRGGIGPKHSGYGNCNEPNELVRLSDELKSAAPSVVVALGGTALWALTGLEKISKYRGTVLSYGDSNLVATYHPAAILRDYSLLPIAAMDLEKAHKILLEGFLPRERKVHVCETLGDVEEAIRKCSSGFAVDVETLGKQITSLSLAPSPELSYVIPLWWPTLDVMKLHSCWTGAEEKKIMLLLNDLFRSSVRKILQNATYDLSYFADLGLFFRAPLDDTMLMAHVHQPEWAKSLGFLGSIYANEVSWKESRVGKIKDRNKTDD